MSIKIIKERDLPLLSRKRITFVLDHPGMSTPKIEAISQEVATELKSTIDCIKIQHVYPQFGLQQSKIIAHVYSSAEALNKIETKHKKNGKQKEKKE
ncbi:MAG: hypothetical protein AABW49_00420 [Nanoarchaeota archaeon]